jgi:hypothetical protein
MGIEEGGEVNAKHIRNIFKNIKQKLPKSWERDTHPGTGCL